MATVAAATAPPTRAARRDTRPTDRPGRPGVAWGSWCRVWRVPGRHIARSFHRKRCADSVNAQLQPLATLQVPATPAVYRQLRRFASRRPADLPLDPFGHTSATSRLLQPEGMTSAEPFTALIDWNETRAAPCCPAPGPAVQRRSHSGRAVLAHSRLSSGVLRLIPKRFHQPWRLDRGLPGPRAWPGPPGAGADSP